VNEDRRCLTTINSCLSCTLRSASRSHTQFKAARPPAQNCLERRKREGWRASGELCSTEGRDAPEGEALDVSNLSSELPYDAGNQRAGAVGKFGGDYERGVAEVLVNSVVSESILSLPPIAASLRVFGLGKLIVESRRADSNR
jgi:hypothetical protein